MVEIQHSEESFVKVNDIEICFDTFGEVTDPPLLLIKGLGEQMIYWDEAFCEQLAVQGFFVIRFDNRDIGLSTKFEEAGVPNLMELMQSVFKGKSVDVPYTLVDMAKDTVGLMEALNINSAHLVGASMGGMIAQTVAIHFPERVRTLTSIMSSTGNPELPQPEPEVFSILITPPPYDRAEYIEYSINTWRLLQGSTYPIDEAYIRERSAIAFDRSFYPIGTGRQMAAIIASGSRKEALKEVNIPTLVIHGDADPLVPVEGGKETAEVIPETKLMIIEGMGHSIPDEIAPQIIEAISKHAH
ncbi:MAG: alpha/beta fold hydrolase [Candidatus Hodarchaeota archaeon]